MFPIHLYIGYNKEFFSQLESNSKVFFLNSIGSLNIH